MGFYHDHVLPRLIHWACGTADIAVCRSELLREAKGVVLEIGFGSGTNLPRYPHEIEARVHAYDQVRFLTISAS